MKTWKEKVNAGQLGICTVKEFTDTEATRIRAKEGVQVSPSSMGFVNLYHGKQYVGFCGIDYAREHRVS